MHTGDLQQVKKHYGLALNIRLRRLAPEHFDDERTNQLLGRVFMAI